MTASEAAEVVFDSWAWWEVSRGTDVGERLWKRYFDRTRTKVVTPALVLGEIGGKLHRMKGWKAADEFVKAVRIRSAIHSMDDDIAALAGQLREHLRLRHRDASLADAIMLATARTLGLPLISQDPCFEGVADVRRS